MGTRHIIDKCLVRLSDISPTENIYGAKRMYTNAKYCMNHRAEKSKSLVVSGAQFNSISFVGIFHHILVLILIS